jgi:hypothetical protein
MTQTDLLRVLLAAVDADECMFDHAETSTWPSGSIERLRVAGFLRESSAGLFAPCPSCADGHIEPVVARADAGGRTRWFIQCPESLRVEVTAEMCRGWEPDLPGLASAVARALATQGAPKALAPGRLWRLGRIPVDGGTREVLLAIRLSDSDASDVTRIVPHGGRSIVIVPHGVPDDRVWPARVPAVVPLAPFARFGDTGLELAGKEFMEAIGEADIAAADKAPVPLDAVAAKKVRRHVKATIESMLSDEALVQAYITNGSYRKAADALNAEGQLTDRWAVERAVKARGGPKAVKASKDSGSVQRTVASQSRDRATKSATYRN